VGCGPCGFRHGTDGGAALFALHECLGRVVVEIRLALKV
jgi:hypothetical protein